MADQVATAVVGEIVKKLIDQISRQFSYLFSYTSNIKSFQDGVRDLENTKDGLMQRVEAGKRNSKEVTKTGNAWLEKVKEEEKIEQEILQGTKIVKDGCMKGWCPNLKQRYLLSRKAFKQIAAVKELINKGETFTEEQLFDPPIPLSMVASSSTTGLEVFKSRISTTNEVFDTLKNESIPMVGICGLGGIGKTRMAKEIHERALKEKNLFDEVAMAEVSQNPDPKKIQDQLATMLGLTLEERNIVGVRAKQLRKRLTQGSRILVILDDLWNKLDLGELGIPVRSEGEANGCKVLITTRSDHVCSIMEARMFPVQLLSDGEAWDLFKQNAGDCVETSEFHSVAEKVLNECGRLPLAIITVGSALKGCQKYVWEDALRQLQSSSVTAIEEMDTKVYASLRLSYDYLNRQGSSKKKNETNQHQQLFLLCCIFPEDSNIPVEDLVRFSVGLRFLNDVEDLESARNRVQSLIDHLKSCHLLEHSDEEGCVKMHDVVRDFGLIEASNGGEHVHMVRHDAMLKEWPPSDAVNPTAISIRSEENLELPPALDYPLLRLLQISAHGSIDLSIDNFRRMKELRVLVIYWQSVSFDYGTKLLDYQAEAPELFLNVRTLCLEECRFSTDIGIIGSMCNLEILSFRYSEIDVLPSEIGRLKNLKLLDLRGFEVGLIESGVLSSLTKLEELYMGHYFGNKRLQELNSGNCASITELNSLSCLRSLQLYVYEAGLIMMLKDFPGEGLTRFSISMSEYYPYDQYYNFRNEVDLHRVELGKLSGSKFEALMRRAEELTLRGGSGWKNIMRESDIDGYLNLKKLVIHQNDELLGICDGNVSVGSMGKLEELRLRSLSAMMYIWMGRVRPPCLINLKVFVIYKCNAIRSLFSPSVVRCLQQLQVLEIYSCMLLEELISEDVVEDDANENILTLPNLKDVNLGNLPHLGRRIASSDISGSHNSHTGSIFSKVLLPRMETLTLESIGGAVKVVNHEHVYTCFNLQKLEVICCNEMEVLFDFQGLEIPSGQVGEEAKVLAQLDAIKIGSLHNLRYIWKNVPKQRFQGFHNLTVLDFYKCHNLRYLMTPCMAKLLVNLQVIEVKFCYNMQYVIMIEEKEVLPQGEIERADKIVFPNLFEVNLEYVYNLKAFCQGSLDLKFPSLKKVSIIDCCNMKKILSSESRNPNFEEVILLPSLETLALHDMPLVKLTFQSGSLSNLRALDVKDCDSMETLFDFEGIDVIFDIHREEMMILGQLDTIEIYGLKELRDIWKNVPKQGGFQGSFHNLTLLDVYDCPNLRYLLSPCMAKLLVNLQVIMIRRCENMEHVIMTTEIEESSHSEIEKKMDEITFPKLRKMKLEELSNLTSFYQGSYDLQFPSLKKVEIRFCFDMKRFFCSESPAHNFKEGVLLPNLEILRLSYMSGVKILVGVEIQSGSMNNLRALNIHQCNSMETLFDFEGVDVISNVHGEEGMVLGQLNAIKLVCLDELRDIWKNVPKQGFHGFHNLTALDVYKCHKLRYLLSPCTVKLLVNLQVIIVRECDNMQHVILTTEIEESSHAEIEKKMDKIVFPRLHELELYNLKNLTAFCHGSYDVQFSSLKNVNISRCSKMKRIFSSESSTHNFEEGVLLPSLETLSLYDMSVVKIVGVEIPSGSLNNLRTLNVDGCHSMETVFDFEGIDVSEVNREEVIILGQLDAIKLACLDELRDIWKNVPKQAGFQGSFHNLTVLDVSHCGNLRYLLSPSMAKFLVNLQVIKAEECEKMEEVIQRDDEEEEMNTIVFPCLHEIRLSKLQSLQVFHEGSCDCVFPLLHKLVIYRCFNMNKFCSSSVSQPKLQHVHFQESSVLLMVDLDSTILLHMNELEVLLPRMETLTLTSINGAVKVMNHEQMYSCLNLRKLEVSFCSEMEVLFDLEGVEIPDGQVGEKVMVLGQLDTIYIKSLNELRDIWKNVPKQGFQGFHNLTKLRVYKCHKLTYLLSPCTAKLLVNLKVIKVEECEYMERVIMIEEEKVSPQCEEVMILGQLDAIYIEHLKELRDIWKNVPKQAGFQGSFHKLTVLDVSYCRNLTYLLSPCMAKLLVNLHEIKVKNCNNMEEVIQRDDEEEKSSCGIEMNTIVFPCLRRIHLTILSSLKAFHKGSCNFVFPLLDELFIYKCFNMNNFCSSSVSQPKLRHVQFEDSSVPLMVDLNTTIQLHMNALKKNEEKQQIEDESDSSEE